MDSQKKRKDLPALVISMASSGHVEFKELDVLGHPKPAGWPLPVFAVEALTKELLRSQPKGIEGPL